MTKLELAKKIYDEQLERLVRIEIDIEFFQRKEISLPHGQVRTEVMQKSLSLRNQKKELEVLVRTIESKIKEYEGQKN